MLKPCLIWLKFEARILLVVWSDAALTTTDTNNENILVLWKELSIKIYGYTAAGLQEISFWF